MREYIAFDLGKGGEDGSNPISSETASASVTASTHRNNELTPIYQGFPRKAEIGHARNQMTKGHLYLIVKNKNEESQAIMILGHGKSKKFTIPVDHEFAAPDLAHRCVLSSPCQRHRAYEEIHMQALSISKDDQNIILETVDFRVRTNATKEHIRKTRIQDFSAQFPILAYNIGASKLIVHDTLKNHEVSYVYKLSDHEHFVSFVEFQKLQSMGFYSDNLHIEACSQIVFLTVDKT